MKNKTDICRFGETKLKRKAIKAVTTPWELEQNQKVNSIISNDMNKSLYNLIKNHPLVVQSPIVNDCLKVNIDDNTRPQIVQKLLLRVFFREVHNSLVSDLLYGGNTESRDIEINTNIKCSTLRSLLTPKLKQNSA